MSRTLHLADGDNPFHSTTLLINPSRYPQYVKILRRVLKRVTIPEVIESRSPEHFVEQVGVFCRGSKRNLLVWGGDGTAHAAINAFMRQKESGQELSRKSLGFLRGGTGNGIQDSYEVPYGIRKQLRAYGESLRNDHTIPVDLMRISTGRRDWYGQLAGFGFDAQVLRARSEKRRKLDDGTSISPRGGYHYLLSGLAVFFSPISRIRHRFSLHMYNGKYAFRSTRVNAEFAFDEIVRDAAPAMIEVGTRPYYGKLFKVCPDVVCNDGNMDLYLFNFTRKVWVARNIVALWLGKHDRINRRLFGKNRGVIERYELTELEVSSPAAFVFHVDGDLHHAEQEPGQDYRVNISVLPRAVSFIVPDHFYRLFHPFDEQEEFDKGATDG